MCRCFEPRQVDQEEADQRDVRPEEEAVARLQDRLAEDRAQQQAIAGRPATAQAASGSPKARDAEALRKPFAEHHPADQQQDDECRRATASCAADSARPAGGTAHSRPSRARPGRTGWRRAGQPPQPAIQDARENRVDEPEADPVGRADGEDDEAPEDRRVHDARVRGRGTCAPARSRS